MIKAKGWTHEGNRIVKTYKRGRFFAEVIPVHPNRYDWAVIDRASGPLPGRPVIVIWGGKAHLKTAIKEAERHLVRVRRMFSVRNSTQG